MEQIFRSIPSVLKEYGADDKAREALVFAAWSRCAGEQLSIRTRALEFFETRLVVAVEDDTWRRHLEDLSPRMIAKLNALLGDGSVRHIEFRVGALAPRDTVKKKARAKKQLIEVDASLAAAADTISNAALRQSFLEAASSCMKRREQS